MNVVIMMTEPLMLPLFMIINSIFMDGFLINKAVTGVTAGGFVIN